MKKNLSYNLLLITIFCCSFSQLEAQSFSLYKIVKINHPDAVSVDKAGQIYIADHQGTIMRFLPDGTADLSFSPQQQGHVSLIEAWNPLKIFVFYDDLQEYLFLDRFLINSESFSLANISNYSGMATLSNDNNLWLIDYVNFGLKKYNLTYHQFTIDTPFDLILDPKNHDITFIREYHNLVFIGDLNSGILIFDNLGNYLRKIPVEGVTYFNFINDKLYYVRGPELVLISIYNLKKEVISLPQPALYGLFSGENLVLIEENSLNIYKILP